MTKIALITGASRGLGRSMALHLAAKGRDIIVTYQSQQAAAEELVASLQAKGRKAVALPLDTNHSDRFTDFAGQVRACLAQHWQRDQFDYLINNAGSGVTSCFGEISEGQLQTMFDQHLKAPCLLSQALLPLICDGGRIVNVSSGLTRFAYPGFAAYATMKAAVETLSLYMAKELGERKITVNTLAPGAIETDFGGGYVRDTQAVNQAIAEATALGRVGLPDDIGGAVAALLDDGAGWINAQRIEVSGGQMI
ncbi:SDR family NAD(P)-dependent oxidoreductase [Halioxenophilus sp. WMMB6]|uniref:SDR family NAD(P)-dependent oxidoreductase n=1 Tax=Halioxenophilus sp. WMMB6 TaxID=3073815 RepID=UPI00295F4B6B|nr:SDR family oxidoreductase [Halioxenophilus sp. WMMB6]